jgi:hypothetical protein
VQSRQPAGSRLLYEPYLYGAARIAFADTRSRLSTTVARQYITPVVAGAIPVDWHQAAPVETLPSALERQPTRPLEGSAQFAALPPEAGKSRAYTAWGREFANSLFASETLEILYSPSQKLYSELDEDERDFRIRISQNAREARDAAVEALRKKYAPRLAALEERLRRANQAVAREKESARQAGMQAAISIGATVLGAFTGRKASSLGRATTAARGVSRSVSRNQNIERAEDTVKAVQNQIQELSAQFEAESEGVAERIDPMTEVLQTHTIKAKKVDISVQIVALVWVPYWMDGDGEMERSW